MLGDALSWYMTSLADFWGSAIRIGLPQILLIVLVIWWLRRKGGGGSCGDWCRRMWSCGEDEESRGDPKGDCGCDCGECRCRRRAEVDADAEGDDEEE